MCKIADALEVSLDEFRQKGEFYMPDITNGREKINAFLKEKGIKKTTLAVAYGFKRQEVTNILSGTTKGPRANSFILQVIEDYGIEQETFEEQKGEPMEEIKIREDKVSLNGQELKTLTGFEIKSTTENGYAEVKLTLLAKLT